jgi:hypothetical protein
MLPFEKTSLHACVAKLSKSPSFVVSAIVTAGLCGGFGAFYVQKLQDYRDYARYATPREGELVHETGQIAIVSNHIPYLEVHLDDGRDLLATFLVFPQHGGHNIYVRDTGAFDREKLALLADCGHAEFEFYPIHGSMISYWIYGLRCNGTEMLSYKDTMTYLALRKP